MTVTFKESSFLILLLIALFGPKVDAFSPTPPHLVQSTFSFQAKKTDTTLWAGGNDEPNPNRRKALAALVIWPLLAVGDDIYISQIQPRLAEQGISTPNIPYARQPVLPTTTDQPPKE